MLIVLSVLYLMLTFIQSNRFLCTYVAGGVYWVGSSGLLSLRGILHPTTRQTAFPARAGPLRKQPRERGGAAVCALSAEGTAALSQSAGQSRMPILHVFYPSARPVSEAIVLRRNERYAEGTQQDQRDQDRGQGGGAHGRPTLRLQPTDPELPAAIGGAADRGSDTARAQFSTQHRRGCRGAT